MARKHNGSAQARWAERKRKQGKCRICGKARGKHKWLCDEHGERFRVYMREWRAKKKAEREAADGGTKRSSSD